VRPSFLIRGGPNDLDLGYVAPGVGDNPLGEYTEIPIVIQDRSFSLLCLPGQSWRIPTGPVPGVIACDPGSVAYISCNYLPAHGARESNTSLTPTMIWPVFNVGHCQIV
jgi:hypothetical protein